MTTKNWCAYLALITGLTISFSSAHATINAPFDFWATDGWNQYANDDNHVGPGGGGQDFDAEYLYYKYNSATNDISIGLQTGFDVVDGKVTYNSKNYYAGDLALSFDGNVIIGDARTTSNSYEYAVDFGLFTKDYYGNQVFSAMSGGANGVDDNHLYQVGGWDNDVISAHQTISSPFAMDWGTKVASLSMNNSGQIGNSYFRAVTFNLDSIIAQGETFTVDSHWTMSCGNDAINGSIQLTRDSSGNPVPEPSVLALFSIGSLGMGFVGYRRRKQAA